MYNYFYSNTTIFVVNTANVNNFYKKIIAAQKVD
jgi:hypothetical protein